MPLLLLTLPLIAIGWVLIVRPQQQRLREQQEMVATLQPGDRVITAGGIHGTLVTVAEETVEIEVAEGVVLTLARPAIARRLDDPATTSDELGTTIDLTDGVDDASEPGSGPDGEDQR